MLTGTTCAPHGRPTRCTGWRRMPALLLVVPLILLAGSLAARAEPRLALVIGNSAYPGDRLPNPVNDAELMARTLESVGFEVTRITDVDQKAMKRAMVEFGRRLRVSDGVGLFYFAGHGVQVDGENYLIPIGADIDEEAEVAIEAVSLGEFLRTMDRSESRLNIVVLDACRNNPFMQRGHRGQAHGLASVDAPVGTIIAYATSPGQLALDGTGRHSPYTEAVAAAIAEGGLTIEEVFKRARQRVRTVTQGKQTPWESSSLTGEFYFKPPPQSKDGAGRREQPGPSAEDERLAEIRAWEAIKNSADIAALRRHLERFPDGLFVELARLRLARLEGTVASAPPASGQVPWTSQMQDRDVAAPADLASAEALFASAVRLDVGDSGEANPAEAAALYRQAAAKGHVGAMTSLGEMLERGRGVPKDLAEAMRLYKRAGDHGSARALGNLALMLEEGRGAVRNYAEAAELYGRAAALGHPPALFGLGRLHDKGQGVTRSVAEANRYYRLAAARGHGPAMTALGEMYEWGEGVDKDIAEALQWYRAAVDKGDAAAQTALAKLYARGKGVPQDLAEAHRLYLLAAEQGHTRAMHQLALLHLKGQGVGLDVREAARWLRAAVARDSEAAMRELAHLLDGGRGVERDPRTAAELLLKAARSGYRAAREDLLARGPTLALPTIRELQRQLTEAGQYRGPAHGRFDDATRKALEQHLKAPPATTSATRSLGVAAPAPGRVRGRTAPPSPPQPVAAPTASEQMLSVISQSKSSP